MANLTKEERLKRDAEKEAQLKAEIEEKIRKEYEEKLKQAALSASADTTTATTPVRNKIPLDTTICVNCNIEGRLHYRAKNGSVSLDWDGLGASEYMTLAELVTMRNTDRKFFEYNWITLEDSDGYTASQLYDFLKVSKYYENVLTPDEIDSVFEMDDKEILKVVSGYSKGVKDTIAVRAKGKIDSKELDSNKKIEALETALNVKFSI